MKFAIKAEVKDRGARTFIFTAQKTMYGGKRIARGDTILIFASENEGGTGLIASGVVIGRGGCEEGGDRPADAARERRDPTDRAGQGALGAERAEAVF